MAAMSFARAAVKFARAEMKFAGAEFRFARAAVKFAGAKLKFAGAKTVFAGAKFRFARAKRVFARAELTAARVIGLVSTISQPFAPAAGPDPRPRLPFATALRSPQRGFATPAPPHRVAGSRRLRPEHGLAAQTPVPRTGLLAGGMSTPSSARAWRRKNHHRVAQSSTEGDESLVSRSVPLIPHVPRPSPLVRAPGGKRGAAAGRGDHEGGAVDLFQAPTSRWRKPAVFPVRLAMPEPATIRPDRGLAPAAR